MSDAKEVRETPCGVWRLEAGVALPQHLALHLEPSGSEPSSPRSRRTDSVPQSPRSPRSPRSPKRFTPQPSEEAPAAAPAKRRPKASPKARGSVQQHMAKAAGHLLEHGTEALLGDGAEAFAKASEQKDVRCRSRS